MIHSVYKKLPPAAETQLSKKKLEQLPSFAHGNEAREIRVALAAHPLWSCENLTAALGMLWRGRSTTASLDAAPSMRFDSEKELLSKFTQRLTQRFLH